MHDKTRFFLFVSKKEHKNRQNVFDASWFSYRIYENTMFSLWLFLKFVGLIKGSELQSQIIIYLLFSTYWSIYTYFKLSPFHFSFLIFICIVFFRLGRRVSTSFAVGRQVKIIVGRQATSTDCPSVITASSLIAYRTCFNELFSL